ncbi:MAG TPA: alpha/beta hydrolase [Acidimicrobiales bacterium]|nr:alpha/beta hydrolase [Acidimicrobiales bacterium]
MTVGTGPVRAVLSVGDDRVTVVRGGRGDPVVYLHGVCDIHAAFPGDAWTPFLARLAEHAEVVAPALPGYNASTGTDRLEDVEDYVWHLGDLWAALGLGRVDVVGHSLGGWLAAELALRRPELVRRLALVAPLGLHVPGLAVPPFFGAVAPRGVGGAGEARRLLFADPDGDPAGAALPDVMARDQQLLWFGGLAGAARLGWKAPHFQSRKLAARLGRIGVDTLVVCGDGDVLVPAVMARAWVDGLASARLVAVPGAGHCVALEAPEAVHEVVRFLAAGAGP